MKILNKDPNSWDELQSLTAKFLEDIGYEAKVEEDILTVRGNVNIDVFAKNKNVKPSSIIVCECKYWNSAIPQTIIHAFRTVVSDIGAAFPVYFRKEYSELTHNECIEFERLNMEYFHTAFYSMEHDYKDLETKEFDIKYFEQHIKEAEKIYGIRFSSYEDFFEHLILDAKEGVEKFDKLFKKELRKKNL